MKITIKQEHLTKALQYVSRVVSSKPNIPVLSNILLEASKTDLRLSATNLDMGIDMWIPASAEVEGKTTVSGKFLTDFVHVAGSGKVTLELKNNTLVVNTENSIAEFNTIPATEFPVLPRTEGEPLIVVDRTQLISSLDKVVFACATDLATSKIQYSGVLFKLLVDAPDKLELVGVDGYRMSRKYVSTKSKVSEDEKLIVPAKALVEFNRIIANEEAENIEIFTNQSRSQAVFKVGDIEFSVRLLEGPYPDYERVIPTDMSYSFDVDRSALEQSLKIVNTFARTIQGYRVHLDLDLETETLTLSTKAPDLGRNETKIKVSKVHGSSDLKDAYNLQYLLECVNHLTSDTLTFQTNAPLEPAMFTEKDNKNFLHIIMPMQRDD